MPPRPSNSNRSIGNSQVGTRHGGNLGREAAVTGRNTSQTGASALDRNDVSTSISQQTRTSGTNPDSQSTEHSQGPNNRPATDERQTRNHSNTVTECDGGDPAGNRKRKLNQAITEALISSIKKPKTGYAFSSSEILSDSSSFLEQTRKYMVFIAVHAVSLGLLGRL